MDVGPLQLLPEDKWLKLESSLKLDWPRSIFVINVLDTLRLLPDLRRSFDFRIYCPYGDVSIGVVVTCSKKSCYEVIIHCSRDLETFLEAIKRSKAIHWDLAIVQFTDRRVMESVSSTLRRRNVEYWHLETCDIIYLERDLFDVRTPEDVKFGLLSVEHVEQVNSVWKHRYPGLEWYFEQLIKCNLGYGIFDKKSNTLIAWSLYTESGIFDYMYVLDSHRRKGYAELLIKIANNFLRKDRDYIYSFCVKGNSAALTLFHKLGYKVIGELFSAIFKDKARSKI